MSGNFIYAITATAKEIKLFTVNLATNPSFLSFFGGLVLTFLIVGFIISKDPRHIPLILRYSSMDSFQKIAATDQNGTYQTSFVNFVKVYTQIRLLSLIAAISFFVMITTIVLTQK